MAYCLRLYGTADYLIPKILSLAYSGFMFPNDGDSSNSKALCSITNFF